jgi:hypothetical protein
VIAKNFIGIPQGEKGKKKPKKDSYVGDKPQGGPQKI